MASKKMKDEVPPEGSQEEERIESLERDVAIALSEKVGKLIGQMESVPSKSWVWGSGISGIVGLLIGIAGILFAMGNTITKIFSSIAEHSH